MNKILKFALVILTATVFTMFLNKLKAQTGFQYQCAERFTAFSVWYSPGDKGGMAGFEIMKWASVDARMSYGFNAGLKMTEEQYYDPIDKEDKTRKFPVLIAGLSTMFKINRFIHPTAGIELEALDKLNYYGGVRLMLPVKEGKTAFWAEPAYGNTGMRCKVAIGISLD